MGMAIDRQFVPDGVALLAGTLAESFLKSPGLAGERTRSMAGELDPASGPREGEPRRRTSPPIP